MVPKWIRSFSIGNEKTLENKSSRGLNVTPMGQQKTPTSGVSRLSILESDVKSDEYLDGWGLDLWM